MGGPSRSSLRFFRHFPPQLGEMQEPEAKVGISGRQRGALALNSFSTAQPNSRAFVAVQEDHGRQYLPKAMGSDYHGQLDPRLNWIFGFDLNRRDWVCCRDRPMTQCGAEQAPVSSGQLEASAARLPI